MADQTIDLYVGDDADPLLCHGRLDLLVPIDDIPLVDKYDRPAGILVSTVDRLLIFQTWNLGTHEFAFAETGFSAHVCLPVPNNCFRGFVLDDGSIITGDIWLVGDDGIVLSYAEVSSSVSCDSPADATIQGQYIRVDVVGDPLFRQRLCAGAITTPRFLQTLTFEFGGTQIVCTPDELGEIKMTAGRAAGESTILRIRNVDGSLRVETVGEAIEGNTR